jgi:hypothetical protein
VKVVKNSFFEREVKTMNVLLVILLSLTYWSFTPIAQAASPGAGLMQAQKEAEAKGFRFDGNREELVAKAKKEGALRALLGFDKPTIVALRDGFRKKYPFINPQFEEHGNPAESQRYLLELQTGRTSDWDIVNVLNEGQQDYAPYTEKIDLRAMAEQGVLQIPPKMINPESRNVIALSSTIDASAYNKKLTTAGFGAQKLGRFLEARAQRAKTSRRRSPQQYRGPYSGDGTRMGRVLRAQARRATADLGARPHALSAIPWRRENTGCFSAPYYHGVMRMKKRGAQDLEVLLTEPVPVRLTETHTIVKGTRRPNAAMLFLEYVASAEGQKIMWDVEPFKSSIYSPGSKTEELARGKKISLGDWDHGMKQQVYMEKLTAAFGFPREDKK